MKLAAVRNVLYLEPDLQGKYKSLKRAYYEQDCSNSRGAGRLLPLPCMPYHRQEVVVPAGARHRGPHLDRFRPQHPYAGQPPVDSLERPFGRHGLCLDPARGPGYRTLRWGLVRPESCLFRSGEHRETGRRGRLQRRGLDFRGARVRGAEIRTQDTVHR